MDASGISTKYAVKAEFLNRGQNIGFLSYREIVIVIRSIAVIFESWVGNRWWYGNAKLSGLHCWKGSLNAF
jgi:hypothetical protein